MHQSSFHLMKRFVALLQDRQAGRPARILDVGSMGVNGTFRELFLFPGATYIGLDIAAGPNVDIVPEDPYKWSEIEDQSCDAVISGQALEHVEFPWLVMEQIQRKLKPGGLACIIVPSRGPVHRHPVDCYRYYPDGLRALAKWAGLTPLEVEMVSGSSGFRDGSDQWGDCHCVLMRTGDASPAPGAGAPRKGWQRRPPAPAQAPLSFDEILGAVHKLGLRAGRVLELTLTQSIASRRLKEALGATSYQGLLLPGASIEAAAVCHDSAQVADPDTLDTAGYGALGLGPGSVDAILAVDMVEALLDPWGALARLGELLRPGGHLVFSVGNVQHSSVLLGLAEGAWGAGPEGVVHASKLRFFTIRSIEDLVTSAGLQMKDVTAVLGSPLDMAQINDAGNTWSKGKLTLSNLTRDEVVRLFAAKFIVVAQRPA